MGYTQVQLLRRWMMQNGVHPDDIAVALTWYEQEVQKGNRVPTNVEVWGVARKHAREVGRANTTDTDGLAVEKKLERRSIRIDVWLSATTGGTIGALIGSFLWGLLNG